MLDLLKCVYILLQILGPCLYAVQHMWSYCCLVDWYYCVNFLVTDGSSEGEGYKRWTFSDSMDFLGFDGLYRLYYLLCVSRRIDTWQTLGNLRRQQQTPTSLPIRIAGCLRVYTGRRCAEVGVAFLCDAACDVRR